MKSLFESNQTFFITERHDVDMLIWKLRQSDDLIELINNIIDVEQDEIDDKDVEFEKFEDLKNLKLCLYQKFAANQRFDWLKLKLECRTQIDRKDFCFERIEFFVEFATKQIFDWLINSQNAKRIFLFVCYSNSFQITSLFFRQSMNIFLSQNFDVSRAAFIFWKRRDDVFKCIKKNVVCIMWKTFSRKLFDRKTKD